jgi:hypothetical protein
MSKDQKPKGRKADVRQQLYAAKREHDDMLKKYHNIPQHIQDSIISTRDLIWNEILSQEERDMPFFKKECEGTV